ncbi:MAG: hypothetical protein AAGG44_14685, partial [Planctomycetota bacterium]
GDKLTDDALLAAVKGTAETMRPWLDVRMPKFDLHEEQVGALTELLIRHDRIPDQAPHAEGSDRSQEAWDAEGTELSEAAITLAGSRLVTSDGFGCQSCHQIGGNAVPKVDLKARGTNLSQPGKRIREAWFQRWVRNPSRIVARMEMPAIQTPAVGILGGDLDRQINSLWQSLNADDFHAPKPNPARVVRSTGAMATEQQANLVTCVVETDDKNYLRPMVIGLANRHNILFDLEDGSLAGWWIGDTAYQYTRGKTWFWELGNPFLGKSTGDTSTGLQSLALIDGEGELWEVAKEGQVAVKLDHYRYEQAGIRWSGRIHFARNGKSRWVPYEQFVVPHERGVDLQQYVAVGEGDSLRIRVAGAIHTLNGNAREMPAVQIPLDDDSRLELRLDPPSRPQLISNGNVESKLAPLAWGLRLWSRIEPDHLPEVVGRSEQRKPKTLECVPGFDIVELPLPRREMPISMAWGPDGSLYVGSLKGNVLRAVDSDGDGLHDRYEQISDSIPTPYGMQFHSAGKGLDVLTKFALVRLSSPGVAKGKWNAKVVADGWGYTADYHDWAVGLEKLQNGGYLIALPCQQDQRSEAAAYLRGHAVVLRPTVKSEGTSRQFALESFAAGLRFPMGIAINSEGDIFASDNQGNYNPFNELNHIRRDKRYGFINKLENRDGYSPSFESPAINLPHPWTRSVNGICFLTSDDASRFGPFAGHLIGCEMNGRSLVRMTLQKVNGAYQGAAYDFSLPGLPPAETFEGPIVCGVSPRGDLYVGSLHDSGWGGGQNTGSIARVRLRAQEFPLGIVEATATARGFRLLFSQPVNEEVARQPSQFRIRSYTRVSTPAYGGDDQNDQIETINAIRVSDDRKQVELDLDQLRAGYVYEINVGAIGAAGEQPFPRTAHYTMRSVPND